MNNEVVKEIRKEDKKKLKGYLILCIIGLLGGGVGGYAVEALARSGIGKLIIVDFDGMQDQRLPFQGSCQP